VETRKVIKRGVVCVVLGAVTTVAVAWGFAVRGVKISGTARFIEYGPFAGANGSAGWVVTSEVRWPGGKLRTIPGVEPTFSLRANDLIGQGTTLPIPAFGDGWGRGYDALTASMARSGADLVIERSHGWPLFALWLEGERFGPGTMRMGGIPLPARWGGPTAPNYYVFAKVLPLRPLWGGFAINTAVYAALFAVPVCGWPMARARRRMKRGLCVRCGYDLAGAGICSECGWGKD